MRRKKKCYHDVGKPKVNKTKKNVVRTSVDEIENHFSVAGDEI
jgi:hypothetical protein